MKWWKRRQLAKAQEQYARVKGRREVIERLVGSRGMFAPYEDKQALVRHAGNEALYLERTERLMRDL